MIIRIYLLIGFIYMYAIASSPQCNGYQCDSVALRKFLIACGANEDSVNTLYWLPNGERLHELAIDWVMDSIPSEIGGLTSLKRLTISGKKIKYIPPAIGNLTSLEWLDLSDNQLEELPNEIGRLKNLKRLDLSKNNLRTLPDSIVNLTSFEMWFDVIEYYCEFDDNYLCSLPDPVIRWIDTWDAYWYLDQKEPCNRDNVIMPRNPGLQGNLPESMGGEYLYTLKGHRVKVNRVTEGKRGLPHGCYIVPVKDGYYRSVRVQLR